jgi:hypothetical protein
MENAHDDFFAFHIYFMLVSVIQKLVHISTFFKDLNFHKRHIQLLEW